MDLIVRRAQLPDRPSGQHLDIGIDGGRIGVSYSQNHIEIVDAASLGIGVFVTMFGTKFGNAIIRRRYTPASTGGTTPRDRGGGS